MGRSNPNLGNYHSKYGIGVDVWTIKKKTNKTKTKTKQPNTFTFHFYFFGEKISWCFPRLYLQYTLPWQKI